MVPGGDIGREADVDDEKAMSVQMRDLDLVGTDIQTDAGVQTGPLERRYAGLGVFMVSGDILYFPSPAPGPIFVWF